LIKALKYGRLFLRLSDEQLQRVNQKAHRMMLKEGEALFHQQDSADVERDAGVDECQRDEREEEVRREARQQLHDRLGQPADPRVHADPHADHEMGVDCDYCLIAARLITLLVAAVLLLAPMAPVCRALRGAVQTLPQRISGTLGARGPPALMAV